MPHKIIIIMVVVFISAGFVAWDMMRAPEAIPTDSQTQNIPMGDAIIPNAAFASIDGKTLTLHDFKGKIIILNFWATWCPPCIVEFPELLQLAAMRPDKIVFIALSVNDRKDKIKPFLQKNKFDTNGGNIIIGHDRDKSISQDLFQTTLYPETFIIAPDLTIKKKVSGIIDWTREDIVSFIDGL